MQAVACCVGTQVPTIRWLVVDTSLQGLEQSASVYRKLFAAGIMVPKY